MFKAVKNFLTSENGNVDVGSMILVAISFVGLVVIIIMFPILITGIESVTNLDLTNYTGLGSIVKLTPLLAWVGAVIMTIVTGYLGVKRMVD